MPKIIKPEIIFKQPKRVQITNSVYVLKQKNVFIDLTIYILILIYKFELMNCVCKNNLMQSDIVLDSNNELTQRNISLELIVIPFDDQMFRLLFVDTLCCQRYNLNSFEYSQFHRHI